MFLTYSQMCSKMKSEGAAWHLNSPWLCVTAWRMDGACCSNNITKADYRRKARWNVAVSTRVYTVIFSQLLLNSPNGQIHNLRTNNNNSMSPSHKSQVTHLQLHCREGGTSGLLFLKVFGPFSNSGWTGKVPERVGEDMQQRTSGWDPRNCAEDLLPLYIGCLLNWILYLN